MSTSSSLACWIYFFYIGENHYHTASLIYFIVFTTENFHNGFLCITVFLEAQLSVTKSDGAFDKLYYSFLCKFLKRFWRYGLSVVVSFLFYTFFLEYEYYLECVSILHCIPWTVLVLWLQIFVWYYKPLCHQSQLRCLLLMNLLHSLPLEQILASWIVFCFKQLFTYFTDLLTLISCIFSTR